MRTLLTPLPSIRSCVGLGSRARAPHVWRGSRAGPGAAIRRPQSSHRPAARRRCRRVVDTEQLGRPGAGHGRTAIAVGPQPGDRGLRESGRVDCRTSQGGRAPAGGDRTFPVGRQGGVLRQPDPAAVAGEERRAVDHGADPAQTRVVRRDADVARAKQHHGERRGRPGGRGRRHDRSRLRGGREREDRSGVGTARSCRRARRRTEGGSRRHLVVVGAGVRPAEPSAWRPARAGGLGQHPGCACRAARAFRVHDLRAPGAGDEGAAEAGSRAGPSRVEAELRAGQPRRGQRRHPRGEVPDEEMVITAHLDHYKPGANDNASGSGAILEMARTMCSLIGLVAFRRRSARSGSCGSPNTTAPGRGSPHTSPTRSSGWPSSTSTWSART